MKSYFGFHFNQCFIRDQFDGGTNYDLSKICSTVNIRKEVLFWAIWILDMGP